MDISFKIRQLQKISNISQKVLAEKIGFSVPAFSKALQRNDFKISVLQKIADALGVSIGYFFGEETNKEASQIISEVVNYRFNHEIKEKIRGSNLIENLRKNITFDKLSVHNKELIINIYSDAQTMPLEHFKQKELDILREQGVLNEFFYLIISFIKSNANNIEIYERKKPTK